MRFIVGRITSFSPEIEFFSHLFLLYLRIFEDSILENNYGVLNTEYIINADSK